MKNEVSLLCKVMVLALVAIVQTMGPAHGQNRSPKGALAVDDFEACRAEIEEGYNLRAAEVRQRMESRVQDMKLHRRNAAWLKQLEEKQGTDQRYLDEMFDRQWRLVTESLGLLSK